MISRPFSDSLLRPKVVAVYGASGDVTKNTARPQRYLKTHGFPGQIIPINPKHDTIQGDKAYPSLSAAPKGVEHAIIMVPKPGVLKAVHDCAEAGAKVATIYSDGFAETGAEGRALQDQIVSVARAHQMRIIGPNSMGVIDLNTPMPLSINYILEMSKLPAGSLGVISQSGSLLGALMSRGAARGIGFSSLLSVGNEADLSVAELIEILTEDHRTEVILLFLEGIRDPRGLGRAARRAYAAGKPVIAYKLGRSDVGRELAITHSGAIAGPDEAVDALLRYHGIMRVDMLESLIELPALALNAAPATGTRVAVMTTTGGGAAMVVDRLGAAGMELVPAPDRMRIKCAELGLELGHGRLIDLTMAGSHKEIYGAALQALLDDEGNDAVVAVVGSSGQFHPEVAVHPISIARRGGKPLAVFIVPNAPESLEMLTSSNVAAFRTPEACADSIRAFLSWNPPVVATKISPPPKAIEVALSGAGKNISEVLAREVLRKLGINFSSTMVLAGPQCEIPRGLVYPIAAKIISPDLPHKTDAKAVILGIKDEESLRVAMKKIWDAAKIHKPEARLEGIMVEPMIEALAEVLIGFRHDKEVGPLVILGAGGVMTEIYKDTAVRPAPIGLDEARSMVDEVKGLAIIRGFRNFPLGDLDALSQAVAAMSRLALLETSRVIEAEINPLLILEKGRGVVAVDALICRDP
ncbi:MAG: hypothetical protein CBB68_02515 [Rhodospirillaceae bacterium TMED8]|nr:acyl-CoA synthetase [Magnetovibrio sp.]OUT52247.1 MAG: hypothetical protein CBB68_02515 [Rhodospirillaceae bacterium TMED8]|tara:strand:+ start:7637 stop:9721 length:2085 start_codon:yes stop_codon:yes gene_type:complete